MSTASAPAPRTADPVTAAPPPPLAYVNGRFLPQSEATISIMDRGFLFADGIYEVAAVIDGKLVDLDLHLARLGRSVGEIGLALPEPLPQIGALMREIAARNHLTEGLIYLQVTRGADQTRGFPFPAHATPTLVMFIEHMAFVDTPKSRGGIAVKSVPDLRWARRDIKSVALLAQVLAKQAAAEAGCQEAWMHEDGVVTEGGSSTAWIVKDGRIITRENGRTILPGCTRTAVETLIAETGMTLETRAFTLVEAYQAEEAFNTSATSLVLPVVSIDGHRIGTGRPGPIATRLRTLYVEAARRG
jgi:D-alanine transaminase